MSNVEALLGRAKRKTITQKSALSLIDVARRKKKGKAKIKSYWNTYHCQSRLVTSEGRSHAKYCKNRFCTICLSIRKATIINKYLPFVVTWEDPHFVALTVKAIPARLLPKYCKGFLKLFGKIVEKHRKRNKRGKGPALMGIRSLECNFNPVKRTYNPHFHVLVKNKEMADILLSEWLGRYPVFHANKKGQHCRRVVDKQHDLLEMVKYGSKIFTEPDLKSWPNKSRHYVYASAWIIS